MKTMTAKFASICPACQKQIRKGSPINYDPRQRKAWHVECIPAAGTDTANGPDWFDMLVEDRMAEACGLGGL